jgi:molecular chaperone GrpE
MENKAEMNATEESTVTGETPVSTAADGVSETLGPETAGEGAALRKEEEIEAVTKEAPESEPGPNAIQAMEAKLAETEVALKTATDRYMRTVAELDNFKKRTARETEEFRKYANTALVQKLLPALDNMERAMDSAGSPAAGASAILEGLRMTLADILKVFGEFHVKPVEAEGKPFDPVYHMAVAHEETDAADPDTVIRVFQKGYIMHDRLIRPAMVSVAKARTVPAEQDGNSAAE